MSSNSSTNAFSNFVFFFVPDRENVHSKLKVCTHFSIKTKITQQLKPHFVHSILKISITISGSSKHCNHPSCQIFPIIMFKRPGATNESLAKRASIFAILLDLYQAIILSVFHSQYFLTVLHIPTGKKSNENPEVVINL